MAGAQPARACNLKLRSELPHHRCALGATFGCHNGNTMWSRNGCTGSFICAGSLLNCSSDGQRLHGRAYCTCNCPDASELNFTPANIQHPSASPPPPPPPPTTCVTRREYVRSDWESWWLKNVPTLLDSAVTWRCGCTAIRQNRKALREWMRLYNLRQGIVPLHGGPCASVSWDSRLFSHHAVVERCPGARPQVPLHR